MLYSRVAESLHERLRGETVELRMKTYTPPDPTMVENKPEALDYWARTLETTPEKVGEAVRKAGPVLEDVKKEIGSFGTG
jgi:hypothetical protein